MPVLFVIQGKSRGTRVELDGLDGVAITIGRESGNVVQVDDNEVSRRHAEIRKTNGAFLLGDLKSSNGTFLNDERIERSELTRGDRIRIGRTVLLFAQDASDLESVPRIDIVPPAGADGSRIISSLGVPAGLAGAIGGGRDDDSIQLATPGGPQGHWLARARSNLQVMYRTTLAVSHTLDIDDLLARVLELVFEWVEADRGCIMLLDADSGVLKPKARRDRREGRPESMVISQTILDYVLANREGVLTSDAREDDRFSGGHSVVRTGVREAICVPMQGRYEIVGVIYVDTTTPLVGMLERGRRRFTDEHLKLMIAIGHQAALAVEDTTHYSALVQAERLAAVGHTIATLSHHIKNILQGIRGGSYLVEMGLENEDLAVLRKGWDIVRRNQDKISSLVMDMLSFSKERKPELVEADLAAVVADVVETVQHRAVDAGIRVTCGPAADLPRCRFDPEGISRAVLNVVTNALDAVEERPDGAVTITTTADTAAGLARIVVTDNGPGMPAERLAEIFNLFVSTKGARGTGLGLTVSRKILREHGGDIRAESTVGTGSRFVLEFPLRLEPSGDDANEGDAFEGFTAESPLTPT